MPPFKPVFRVLRDSIDQLSVLAQNLHDLIDLLSGLAQSLRHFLIDVTQLLPGLSAFFEAARIFVF